jgi:hypothetical protein
MNFPRCEPPLRNSRRLAALLALLLAAVPLAGQQQPSLKANARKGPDRKDEVRDRLLLLDLRTKGPPALPADVVVQKMMETSARRSAELRGLRATRSYHLEYHGFLGTREASMRVVSTYRAPDQLDFSIVAENGSKLLLNRVLLKLLDSEREAFRDQSKIELSPANYRFDSQGIERSSDGDDPCYVLGVNPRKENRFLYRGKVWIDAYDFALSSMEGQPAKSPSFWIKDTQIDSTWAKVGKLWLIQHSRSVSHIRMGGMATLTIDYSDYQITGGAQSQGRGQHPQLPDPSSVTPQR